MPDISMLVEIAEFYEVDIREIIDGERKSENMNDEVKVTYLFSTFTDTRQKCMKIASQWHFCTPESCFYGLSSKCFDLF